jgi:hypothetical protein
LAAAEPLYRECAELARVHHDRRSLSHALFGLGEVVADRQGPIAGLPYLQQSLTLRQELGNRPEMANALGAIGMLFFKIGQTPDAITLMSASMKLLEELGIRRSASSQAEQEAHLNLLRNSSGEDFDEKWAAGQKMLVDEVVDLALRFP